MQPIKDQIKNSIEAMSTLSESDIMAASKILVDCLKRGNKILVAGNGGSASDASHMAGELVGRFKKERKGLPCIALTTDTSVITAWSNDYDFSTLFSRQIEALGKPGDVFIGISTSGNSENIIKAVDQARLQGMEVVLLLGKDGGKLGEINACSVIVKSNDTPRIQESHILVIHLWCDIIENELFKEG